jgi:hypothetical protein
MHPNLLANSSCTALRGLAYLLSLPGSSMTAAFRRKARAHKTSDVENRLCRLALENPLVPGANSVHWLTASATMARLLRRVRRRGQRRNQ